MKNCNQETWHKEVQGLRNQINLKLCPTSATYSVHELGQIIPEIGFPEQQNEMKIFTIPRCEEG